MNAPFSDLDAAIANFRNILISGGGEINYNRGQSGELSWTDTITIAYTAETGVVCYNYIGSGEIGLTDDEFIYVDLNDVPDTFLTVAVGQISGEQTSEFTPHAGRLVLVVKDSTDDRLYLVNLRPTLLSAYEHAYDVGGTWVGQPDAGAVIQRFPFPRTVAFDQDFAGSEAVCATAAVDDNQKFELQKGGSEIGSIRFNSGETVAWFSGEAPVTFISGEVLTVIAPNPQDSALSDIGWAIAGKRYQGP